MNIDRPKMRSDFVISIGISNADTVSYDVIALTDNFISRKTDEAQNLFNCILSLRNPCFKSIYGIIFFLIEENLLNM